MLESILVLLFIINITYGVSINPIIFYSNANYSGKTYIVSSPISNICYSLNNWNSTINSLKITNYGNQVELYYNNNCQGTYKQYSGNNANLDNAINSYILSYKVIYNNNLKY